MPRAASVWGFGFYVLVMFKGGVNVVVIGAYVFGLHGVLCGDGLGGDLFGLGFGGGHFVLFAVVVYSEVEVVVAAVDFNFFSFRR